MPCASNCNYSLCSETQQDKLFSPMLTIIIRWRFVFDFSFAPFGPSLWFDVTVRLVVKGSD